MKRFLLLLILAGLVAAGLLLFQRTRLARLQGQMNDAATTIGARYAVIVDEQLLPFAGRTDLTEEQRRLIARIGSATEELRGMDVDALEQRLQGITTLQQLLQTFVGSVPGDHALAQEPAFSALTQAIGERGSVRALLTGFNDLAIRWNAAVRGLAGSVLNRIGSADGARPLPFLRFDGVAEFVPQINL